MRRRPQPGSGELPADRTHPLFAGLNEDAGPGLIYVVISRLFGSFPGRIVTYGGVVLFKTP
jgi:hypothetical protein